jgi:hypothetical protein
MYVLYTSNITLNKWQVPTMSVVISFVVEDYEDTQSYWWKIFCDFMNETYKPQIWKKNQGV